MERIKPFAEGDAIDLETLNLLVEAANSGKLKVIEPLYLQRLSDGFALGCDLPEQFWAKITGGTNPYDFTEQVRSGGGWVDGPRASTTDFKASEVNSNSTIPAGTYVLLFRVVDGWIFQLTTC